MSLERNANERECRRFQPDDDHAAVILSNGQAPDRDAHPRSRRQLAFAHGQVQPLQQALAELSSASESMTSNLTPDFSRAAKRGRLE